ncbi:MAG: ubiquitin-activating E1 FCCH domain-containing protein [Pseudomonadota bacterium]
MQIVNRTARRLKAAARRFASDTRGNVALIFAIVLPVLLLMSLSGLDLHRASSVKMNLQDALDAATLAAARSEYVTDADLTRVGLDALRANLAPYKQIALVTASTTFHLTEDSKVIGDARVSVDAIVANIFLPPYGQLFDKTLPVNAHTEVNRASHNVEVALVLDTTTSMGQSTKLADLKAAAKDLVDIVVQARQTPWYSKVSIVPYSMAVNVGTAATTARGSYVTAGTNITAITWANTTPKAVTAATKASPVVITAAAHGYANGDKVVIWGQTGMTQLNGRIFTVANKTNNTFQLSGVDGRYYSTFATGGTLVARCARTDCYPTVTSAGHGSTDGNYVYLSGITGMTQLNSQTLKIDWISNNQFYIETVGYGVFGTTGTTTCRQVGCEYQAFINQDGDLTTFKISTCVTERTGTNAYTDVAPGTTRMGRNYPSTATNPCIANLVRPLSSDKDTIKTQIDSLTAAGSTGGHIGVGWGWYTVSPNFNSMWSAAGAAGAYDADKTLKAVVIMTDGEYNSAYCNGVISQDSTLGSDGTATHINCNAPNGNPFSQSLALCTAMKARGVTVYTVGFQVVSDQRAQDLVNNCATDAQHVYLPSSGSDLRQAFQAIGRDITSLRISR